MNRCMVSEEWRSIAATRPDSVLLETARPDVENRRSLLFVDPVEVLSARKSNDIPALFGGVEEAITRGFHVAGFLGYECGYHFQSLGEIDRIDPDLPLAWFGVYLRPEIHVHEEACSTSHAGVVASPLKGQIDRFADHASFGLSEEDYREKIDRIIDYIRAGDAYQVNFTDHVALQSGLSPAAAFATLSLQQPVPYSALLHIGDCHVLSLSPELFFKTDGDTITTRPMKGTMPRGLDAQEDREAAVRLQNDVKNRAEHVMIVDLLRNDLGRICEMGSVSVDDIFSVERYRTLLQMTSTVTGTLRAGLSYYDIFKSLFPSGSITGAPKIRTMRIIQELEAKPRGVYTGAIGSIAPDRSSIFNVAIRTLVLKNGRASMGVGGGIVADSIAADEYQECLLKTKFLTHRQQEFQLMETLLWDGDFRFLELHLDRMKSSAYFFDYPFHRASAVAQLGTLSDELQSGSRYRVKLRLDSAGRMTTVHAEFAGGVSTGRVRLASERTSSSDVLLRHKTTVRDQYDFLYAAARQDGFDEVLFLNERDEVTEGAISNVFVVHDGTLSTPPLRSGVLPGIFRRHLLEMNPATKERLLTLEDLKAADGVFLCNALRGLRQVYSLCPEGGSGDMRWSLQRFPGRS